MFGSQTLPTVAAVLAAVVSASPVSGREVATVPDDLTGELGCEALKLVYGSGSVFLPGDAEYAEEAAAFWSNTQLMSPTCIFRPTSAEQVASAVVGNSGTGTQWAVRGGGHMGIRGANNIDKGMLIVMSGIKTLRISEDRTAVHVGPGNKWGDVYDYLAQFDVAVAGGRLGPVGVPGLLLGGGVSFYGHQAGWSADNVLEYEVVLADGRTVAASADENQDLFWALKGGSANFGIVTDFKLRTFPSKKVWAGVYTVSGEHMAAFEEAVARYSSEPQDPLSHAVPMVIPMAGGVTVASVILFYDSETVSEPECFRDFLAIPPISPPTTAFKTVAEFAKENGALVVPGVNDVFLAGTTVGKTQAELLEGVQITNKVFLDAVPALHAAIGGADKMVLNSINWQPIGAAWQAASEKMNPAGNALGIDTAAKGTYLAWALAIEWVDGPGHDEIVDKWVRETIAAMEEATKAAGLYDAFNYMGDAAGFQEVYAGYGEENQKKLLEISRKYDPERVTQKLWPGGFKVGV
ncbi:hypothetical protein MCOR22_001740 [Pyricularia oryzae]|nr:hypothetical protein MCOR22_001740 [Pyricularia oryzae]KAI6464084.1 hypothetical protein MCOR17_005456 [Pyricularia oryzae]